MKQLHIFVSGRVQGVGFRYFVKKNADLLGIKGWVRNAGDGGVEILAQGDNLNLAEFLARISKGPSLSQVDDIAKSEEKVAGTEKYFSVKF